VVWLGLGAGPLLLAPSLVDPPAGLLNEVVALAVGLLEPGLQLGSARSSLTGASARRACVAPPPPTPAGA